MNREEVTLLGFEIVVYAGDVRTELLEALKAAERGELGRTDGLIKEAENCIIEVYKAQTSLSTKEAPGEGIAYSVTMMHGQDHLMTILLLEDLMQYPIELHKGGVKYE